MADEKKNNHRSIPLKGVYSEGKFAIVDEDVFLWAQHFHWFVTANGYVATRTGAKVISMHRIIMGNPEGLDIDHVNGDKLDNRREFLRVVTRQQNNRNSKPRRGAASSFKGVTKHKASGKWAARIVVSGKPHSLGLYSNEIDAAKAYDSAVKKFFGEYGWLNFKDVA